MGVKTTPFGGLAEFAILLELLEDLWSSSTGEVAADAFHIRELEKSTTASWSSPQMVHAVKSEREDGMFEVVLQDLPG